MPTSMILALTNGNVGTLVRLRGMVMVILVWVSALGLCALLERVLARASAHARRLASTGSGDRIVTVLDDRGRLFGRVNLVDASVVGFIVLLIPVAYGTWLLFRPKPVQDHVGDARDADRRKSSESRTARARRRSSK